MTFEIHADHGVAGKTVETGVRYIGAFEGRHNDGWVISIDRATLEGTLTGNDTRAGGHQQHFTDRRPRA